MPLMEHALPPHGPIVHVEIGSRNTRSTRAARTSCSFCLQRLLYHLPMTIASINPATAEVIQSFEEHSDAQVGQKLAMAMETFRTYRQTTFQERAQMMNRAAGILESEKERFGRLMTLEMGKTLNSAISESAKCALGCRYYAETAERWLADEVVQ